VLKPYPRDAETRFDRARDGELPLDAYAALGDGRSVALTGADGSIDWWCVPNMDSPPLFDRILAPGSGGYFSITPLEPFTVERGYREGSNVHETVFTTAHGRARLTESLNSSSAGRLPWCELARRIEGLEGRVRFAIRLVFGTRGDRVCPYIVPNANGTIFHIDRVLGLFRHSEGVRIEEEADCAILASVAVAAGDSEVVGIVAGEDEPLVVPKIADLAERIDASDEEWRIWSRHLGYEGRYRDAVLRSALTLKLLLYSPTGAIAAAATTSLPEGIGGPKNYDYRFAWIRDASYVIKAFLRLGTHAEAKAAFTWLIRRIDEQGALVCYTLDGDRVPGVSEIDLPGYRGSRPVRVGNEASDQFQHGVYGDIFETAERFVAVGNILDSRSAQTLSRLADQCAEGWRRKDAGIWELPEPQHYTMSKVSCWQALARAVELADGGHLPTTCRDRWARECARIKDWIEANCWSEARQAYLFHPGSDALDASVALAARFRYDSPDRLRSTLDAIDRELGAGPYHYRYSGMDREEGCFLACSFWMVEAKALLGRTQQAEAGFEALLAALDRNSGTYTEMADPRTGAFLGNMPQGLTHLALIQAAATLSDIAL